MSSHQANHQQQQPFNIPSFNSEKLSIMSAFIGTEISSQSKKRKGNGSNPSELSAESPVQETQVSPKKKNKICMRTLKRASNAGGASRVGAILKLPEATNGIIRKGEVKDVKLLCTITDNRAERMPGDAGVRSGRRFIYVGDCTGFLSLGMVASETGIRKYDVEEGKCTEETRSFFNAITGTAAWIPTRSDPQTPTFFLNKGSIEKVEIGAWNGDQIFMLPTTDVCKLMVKSKFGNSARFSTTGVCGKIDLCGENDDGDLVISLEDPVGYSAVEVSPVKEGTSAQELIERYGLREGNFVFLKGNFEIENIPQHENAVLKIESSAMESEVVDAKTFQEFSDGLTKIDPSWFQGIVPEVM